MTFEPLITTSRLSAARGDADVLHDVSFTLGHGEIVAVLGPNGSGKSTLLEVLGGVLAPSAGTVTRNGRAVAVLQSPDLAKRTVRANVELALAWWGVARDERPARASAALAAMRADHLADRMANELSGGERRRVHLARAFAVAPDVLLLDEPFAGLDAGTRAELLTDAASAIRASARAALIVVHDRAEAWALADRLVVLIEGRVVAEGPPRSLLESPPNVDVARFLGFNGELREESFIRVTRPADVHLDPGGDLRATVTRVIPLEDGVQVELGLDRGRLVALSAIPGPAVGDEVRVTVRGGVRYPTSLSVNA